MENKKEIVALTSEQKEKVNLFKGLSKWLSVDVTIKIFNVVVFSYHYPPKSSVL